ncbi:MAG: hypothetical protein RI907_22 [Pseudomonadota bacterium]
MPTPQEMADLDAEDLVMWRHCPRRFWLARQAGTSPAVVLPKSVASAIDLPGTLAALRATWPHAHHLPPPRTEAQWQAALAETQAWLTSRMREPMPADEGHALLGACVASPDGARARIDVLSPGEGGWQQGWRAGRLRLATAGNDDDVDTIAWWTHVAAHAGVRLQGMVLMLIEQDFVYPGHGCLAGVFREVDVSPVLGSRDVAAWLVGMRRSLRGPEPDLPHALPCVAPGDHERCPHLAHCGLQGRVHDGLAIDALEVMGREVADVLRALGHRSLLTVPPALLKDERRRRAWRAIHSGQPEVTPDACAPLRAWPAPWQVLRLDTIGHALPIWAGTRPYQMVPFQWQVDVVDPEQLEAPRASHHFLAAGAGDPRRAFARSLLAALGSHGTIVAYNAGFERNRLRELARHLADSASPQDQADAAALDALQPRIVDLFQTLRGCAYHPAMRGSWSFKSVGQAFSPDLELGAFSAAHATAAEAYAHAMQDRLPEHEVNALRDALRARAARETLAMRRVLQALKAAGSAP